MFTTPAGSSASAIASASKKLSSTVSDDGFSTTVQPAANAGASFMNANVCGKFHGTMAPTTPSGSRRTSVVPPSRPGRISSKVSSLTRPA